MATKKKKKAAKKKTTKKKASKKRVGSIKTAILKKANKHGLNLTGLSKNEILSFVPCVLKGIMTKSLPNAVIDCIKKRNL